MALILAALLIFITALFYYFYTKKTKYYECLKKYPGPPCIPLLGNIFQYMPASDIINNVINHYKKYGPTVNMWGGLIVPVQVALITKDEKFVEFILSSTSTSVLNKPYSYQFLKSWLGTGLLTAPGGKWKQRRRVFNPTFHVQILEQFVDIFNKQGDILVEKLQKEVGKTKIDITEQIILCTLDVICESAMGTSINAQNTQNSEYVHSVQEMCRIVIERTISLWKYLDFSYQFSDDYKKERKAVKILHDYTDSVIKSRRNKLKTYRGDEEKNEGTNKKKMAFLDLMLHLEVDGKPLSDEDIKEEVATFMFAGHDTTAAAINFAVFSLANNKNIQQTAFEEQTSLLGDDSKRSVTFKELNEMKYLEMVIKETLRLYPSVPTFARCLNEDVIYENTLLPKGLDIYITAIQVHRNPQIYPEPEKFDPERFLPENSSKRSPYSYIPFSAGPRNCIGQKFAMLEMKVILSKLLRNFEFLQTEPKHELVITTKTTLKSKNGVYIQLKKRC